MDQSSALHEALPAWFCFARGRALPRAALSPALLFHECGRGGTGRRATLRSLWAKARGSSSLLDRTSMKTNAIRGMHVFMLISLKPKENQKVVWHDLWLTRAPDGEAATRGRKLCALFDPDRSHSNDSPVRTDLG